MKIMFAIKGMDRAKGGAERVLATVTAELALRNHDVSLLTFDPPGGSSFYPLHGAVRRIALGIGNTAAKATGAETGARMRAMRRAVKAENPDVVVAFMHSMFVPMSFALMGLNIPIIGSEHIVPQHYKSRPLEFILMLCGSFRLKRFTAVSESARASYPWLIRRKMTVLPNPVVAATRRADAAGEGFARKHILAVGRLELQKDHKTLIAAFARLAPRYPDWDLKIFGEGALRDKLAVQIATSGLEGRVMLAGTTADIGAAYAAAQIFALSSRYESFGLATAEAMAHGLPAVGFVDCPGTNELIHDGETGFLATGPDRAAALAGALERLMADPALRQRFGENALTSSSGFAAAGVADLWEKLLHSVCARR